MLTVTALFDLAILYFVAANVLFLLSYVLVVKHKARVIRRNGALVSTTIVDYFRETGTEVGVEAISKASGRRFVALVSSKPSKRFLNSHIVEMVLIAQVRKVCGLDLEKVYWCFPVKERQDFAQRDQARADELATAKADDYFDKRTSMLAKPPGYKVNEVSHERFEALVNRQKPTPDAALPAAELGFAAGD